MPIEIKELYIKAVVSNTPKTVSGVINPSDISKMKKEVVKECVQEVLKKIKEKNER